MVNFRLEIRFRRYGPRAASYSAMKPIPFPADWLVGRPRIFALGARLRLGSQFFSLTGNGKLTLDKSLLSPFANWEALLKGTDIFFVDFLLVEAA